MLGFIAFCFKVVLAAVLGGALSYKPDQLDEKQIIETTLICTFSAAIMSMAVQLANNNNSYSLGSGILAVVIIVVAISKDLSFNHRIKWILSSVTGMLIGSGFIFQSLLFAFLVYLVLDNSKNLLNYINNKDSSDSVETEINNI